VIRGAAITLLMRGDRCIIRNLWQVKLGRRNTLYQMLQRTRLLAQLG
jgi:hypothetical protein